jgi:hypothetical protein
MKGWIAAGTVAVGAVAVRQGLKALPEGFPAYPQQTPPLEYRPLPDLPDPVRRYLEVVVGPELPVLTTAVASGRLIMRMKGVQIPGRWRFSHIVGEGYRHDMELTVFGRKVAEGHEWFVDGAAVLDLPTGRVEGEPTVDSAARLSMWGEYLWAPSALADARWEPIDETRARMWVPDSDQPLTAWFNPETQLLDRFETIRWRDAGDPEPLPWITSNLAWTRISGIGVPAVGAVQWGDMSQPWLRLSLDDVVWNVDVELQPQ